MPFFLGFRKFHCSDTVEYYLNTLLHVVLQNRINLRVLLEYLKLSVTIWGMLDKSGGRNMALSYNKMWKLLIDKKMSRSELRKAADIAPNTMTKLRRDEAVNLAILGRICHVLDCDFGDIMEYIKEGEGISLEEEKANGR